MEVVAAIFGSAVTEAGRSLCGSFPSIKNFISLQSNLSALEKEKKSLVDLKNKVIEDVDYSSDAQMTLWLREVEQITLEVNSAPTGMTASNQKLCGCLFNCSERYRLSKETARRLKEIERLLKEGDIAVKLVGQNYLTKAVEHIPGPSIVNQTTASQNLAKVMDLLNDDDVLRIGVWGMGGVEIVSLLLQGNPLHGRIADGFLQAFESLKVLNISETHIHSLPQSILQLGDLRVLLLKGCIYLEVLPQIGVLSKLQMLDCSDTGIRKLPSGMKNLINLRQLFLSWTQNLKTIQSGIISGLLSLEVLDMTAGAYVWRQAPFEDLQNLERLHSLSIRLEGIPSLQNEDLTLISRLRTFKLHIGPKEISFQSKHDKRKLTISGLQLSGEWIGWLLTNASSMQLNNCLGLNQMLETLVIRSIGSYTGLKSLTISKSSSSLRPDGGCAAHDDLLPNLEELRLYDLTKIESISELVGFLGLRFSRLKLIDVSRCDGLEYLLNCGDFIISLPNLETIQVSSCRSLVELFNFPWQKNFVPEPVVPNLRTLNLWNLPRLETLSKQDGSRLHSKFISCVYHMKAIEHVQQNFVPEPAVPNLRTLKLVNLPRLETLSRQDGSGLFSEFISCVYHMKAIEQVDVFWCYNLRKLPLTIQNVNTMKEIRGPARWWNQLELEEQDTKSSLERFFKEPEPKVLDMTLSAYIWDVKQEAEEAQTTFKELQCLEQLHVLSIRMEDIPTLGSLKIKSG
ncbi:hypothetical protein LWI29_004629 [Acer saccharum]|uniref:Rx N-terminal domain-containing protein n=1 Tax=Acer saccharum TaxID=4024 RepID=A0AA39SXM6_ACESA|nr:hypothetical protein LWI29_004629 [Acer saccharum]